MTLIRAPTTQSRCTITCVIQLAVNCAVLMRKCCSLEYYATQIISESLLAISLKVMKVNKQIRTEKSGQHRASNAGRPLSLIENIYSVLGLIKYTCGQFTHNIRSSYEVIELGHVNLSSDLYNKYIKVI